MENDKKNNSETDEVAKLKAKITALEAKLEKKKPASNMDTADVDVKADSSKEEIAKLREETASLRTELEGKKESSVNMDAMIEKKAMARANLITQASPYLEDQNFAGISDRQIMESTIKSFNNDSMDLTNHSDDYIKGIFDTSVKTGKRQHMDARGMVHKVNMSRRTNNDSLDNVDALEQWFTTLNDKQINSRKGN